VHGVVAPPPGSAQCLESDSDAGRLVDGQLLFDGQMQRHVQKGIDLSVFGGKAPYHDLWIREQAVVFRVFQHDARCDGFEWRKDFLGLMLAPGFNEKLSNLLAGGIEHGWYAPEDVSGIFWYLT